jgi:hypothetical protein
MKIFLSILLLMFVVVSNAWAAGSVTQDFESITNTSYYIVFQCTGDSSDGSIPDTESDNDIDGYVTLVTVTAESGVTEPDQYFDVYLRDSDGVDIMDQELEDMDVSSTTGFQTMPTINYASWPRKVSGPITLSVKHQTAAEAYWEVKVYVEK